MLFDSHVFDVNFGRSKEQKTGAKHPLHTYIYYLYTYYILYISNICIEKYLLHGIVEIYQETQRSDSFVFQLLLKLG